MSTEYNVLLELLKSNGYLVNEGQLELEYLSHPDKPDLISYCNTLDVLGIENLAAELTKDNLDNIENPFIVHMRIEANQQFCLVRSVSKQTIEIYDGKANFLIDREKFLELWDGIVVCVDPFVGQKFELTKILNPIVILISSISIFFNESLNAWQFVYYLLSISGVVVSSLIIQKELGIKNNFSDKFCRTEADAGCNKIIGKRKLELGGLSIGDISLGYFISNALVTLQRPWPEMHLVLVVTGFFSILIIATSIYYQRFVAKTWCKLCLVVSLILTLQIAASSEFFLSPIKYSTSIFYFAAIFSAVVIIVFNLKPFVKRATELREIEIENLTFRKNYNLFDAYMRNQPVINCRLPDGCLEINIGSPLASVELIAISNPMCLPCSKAHEIYEELLDAYGEEIVLKIRFYVPFEDLTDPRTRIAAYFLDFSKRERKQGAIKLLLQKWYEGTITYDDLAPQENLNAETVESLRLQKKWCSINGINQTPSLIINGKKFPSFYRISDLHYYMEACINSASTNNHEYISSYSI